MLRIMLDKPLRARRWVLGWSLLAVMSAGMAAYAVIGHFGPFAFGFSIFLTLVFLAALVKDINAERRLNQLRAELKEYEP